MLGCSQREQPTMVNVNSSDDNGVQPSKIFATTLRSPYAEAYTDDIPVFVTSDVEPNKVHTFNSMDVDAENVGHPVGTTSLGDWIVGEEGDGTLTRAEALKDRSDSSIGPMWGEGRTTWHTNDVIYSPTDHPSGSGLSVIDSERRKREVRRLFGPNSWLKRLNDGTASDDDGNRHECDVLGRISSFCEQLDFHTFEREVIKIYNELPPEPFQPIGGHESADCQLRDHYPANRMNIYPPEKGEVTWNIVHTKVKHNPMTCPHCHQCRCGSYHFGEPPKNGVETRILAAMLLVDERRIKSAEDSQKAFENRLQESDGYNELVTHHALKQIQTLQAARKHCDTHQL